MTDCEFTGQKLATLYTEDKPPTYEGFAAIRRSFQSAPVLLDVTGTAPVRAFFKDCKAENFSDVLFKDPNTLRNKNSIAVLNMTCKKVLNITDFSDRG